MPVCSVVGCSLMQSLRIPRLQKVRCGESCSTRSFVNSAGRGLACQVTVVVLEVSCWR